MSLRKSLLAVAAIMLAISMGASAQESQSQTSATQDGTLQRERIERMEKRRERPGNPERRGAREGSGMGHMMRELNLSDEQRRQSRAILERRLQSTKAQREELFKLREKRIAGTFTTEDEARATALHQEIRTQMEGVRDEMAGVLTAEQKAKLEELRKERKERMEIRMKERQERWNKKTI